MAGNAPVVLLARSWKLSSGYFREVTLTSSHLISPDIFLHFEGKSSRHSLVCFVQLICPQEESRDSPTSALTGLSFRSAGSSRNHLRVLQFTDSHSLFFFLFSFIKTPLRETWLYTSLLCWTYKELRWSGCLCFNRSSETRLRQFKQLLLQLKINDGIEFNSSEYFTYTSSIPGIA